MRKTLIALTAAAPFILSATAFAVEAAPSAPDHKAKVVKVAAKAEVAPEVAKPAPKTEAIKTDISTVEQGAAQPAKGEAKIDEAKPLPVKAGRKVETLKPVPGKVEHKAVKVESKVKAAPAKGESKLEEIKAEPPAKTEPKIEVAPSAKP